MTNTRVARAGALLAVLAAFLLVPALAGAGAVARADNVSQIAEGLRHSRLYVSSEAQGALSEAERIQVRQALDGAKDADLRVVVTKAGVGPAVLGQMLKDVEQRVGKGDTYYAATADGKIVGISKAFSYTEIDQLISQATGGDLGSRLVDLAKVSETKAQDKAASARTTGFVILGVFVVIILLVVGLGLVARNRRRNRQARLMADLREGVQEDVTKLGEDIMALDLKVTDPDLDPAIRDDYTRALDSYDAAKAATEAAARPEDMGRVTTALEDGRYFMTAVRARLAGQPVPERRPPCFFNPQHGPSAQDVVWAPPGGLPRSVPACALDAQAVLNGLAPDSRLVPIGGQRVPYWQAGPAYGHYAGGYYSGYGGSDLLSGMLIGTALGSMFGGGWGGGPGGWGGGWGDGGSGGGGGFDGSEGDIGGGWDFGGGDFGGGGDVGGGDF